MGFVVDLKNEIAEGAFEATACQASYDGGYWQSTGIGRHVTARGLLLAMKEKGCTVLTVKIGLYKGHMHFLSLTDCPHSVYFEADSSMEASEGLNPVSSQGFLEVSAVEAKSMAKAGLIDSGSVWY